MTEEICQYKGKLKLSEKELEWCFAFNASLEDLNCEKCEYKRLIISPEAYGKPLAESSPIEDIQKKHEWPPSIYIQT